MIHLNSSTLGHVGIIEIDRPPNNYFNQSMIAGIGDELDKMQEAAIRAVVLCAAGKNFCAGADFNRPPSETVSDIDGPDHIYRQALRLFKCRLPIIAAVQGAAIGGGLGLALAADFRIATEASRFSANFNRLGFHPGFGLSVTLPRVVGAQEAAELFYTGRRITGTQAHQFGLVDRLVSEDELRDKAIMLAAEIAQSAPIAVQSTRKTLRSGLLAAVESIIAHEVTEQRKHFATADFIEGVKAMAARRLPAFEGR